MAIDVWAWAKSLAITSTFMFALLAMYETVTDKRGFIGLRFLMILTLMRALLWLQTH